MTDNDKKVLIERLLSIAKKEIRISHKPATSALAAGVSKFGGKPSLPAGFEWPYYEGDAFDEVKNRPLSFLAQINLEDVRELDAEHLLPEKGMLSFFYELETMTWGFDPIDNGSAKVYYFPEVSELRTTDIPEDMEEECIVPEFEISFEEHISLPEYGQFQDEDLDPDWDEYNEGLEEAGYKYDEWGDYSKLLGYPDVIQSPMESECEALSRGHRLGNQEDYEKITPEEKEDINAKSSEWMLLFQMGTVSNDDYELMFGDCGHIYFWIRKQDLKERNFDKIWLILQCS